MNVGFAPPRITPRPVAPVRAPVMGAPGNAGKRLVSMEKQALDASHKVTIEDHTIGALHKIRGAGLSLFTFGWVTLPFLPIPLPLPAIAAGILAKAGLKSAQTFTDMALKAPIQALHTTNGSEWYKAPANALRGAASMASASEGDLIKGLVNPLNRAANVAAQQGEKVSAAASHAFQPVRGAMKKGITDFGRTGVGQQLEGALQGVAKHSVRVNTEKSTKALTSATQAFTKEAPGLFTGIKNFVTLSKPAATAVAPQYAAAHALLNDGKLHEGFGVLSEAINSAGQSQAAITTAQGLLRSNKTTDALSHMGKVLTTNDASKSMLSQAQELAKAGNSKAAIKALEEVVTKADKKVFSQGQQVLNHLGKATSAAGTAQTFKDALGKGLSGMVSGAAKAGGNAKLFTWVLAGAATAGIAATVLLTNKEGRVAKQSLKDLTADVGDKNHPIVKAATKLSKGQNGGRWLNAGLSAAGEGVMVTAASLPVAMGIQLMPMATQLIIKENSVLGAYTALNDMHQGRVQVNPEQQVYYVKELMAALPSVAANGGTRNVLAGVVAQEIVNRHLSPKETVQLIADPSKLNALTTHVQQKQQAEAQKTVANENTPAPTLTPANDGPSTQIKAAPMIAAPTRIVGEVANDGLVASRQKAIG